MDCMNWGTAQHGLKHQTFTLDFQLVSFPYGFQVNETESQDHFVVPGIIGYVEKQTQTHTTLNLIIKVVADSTS